jgi:hypothetical protein
MPGGQSFLKCGYRILPIPEKAHNFAAPRGKPPAKRWPGIGGVIKGDATTRRRHSSSRNRP